MHYLSKTNNLFSYFNWNNKFIDFLYNCSIKAMIKESEKNIYKKCRGLKSTSCKKLSINTENSIHDLPKNAFRDVTQLRTKTFNKSKNL